VVAVASVVGAAASAVATAAAVAVAVAATAAAADAGSRVSRLATAAQRDETVDPAETAVKHAQRALSAARVGLRY
jgi:hypothetical protein